MHKKGKIKINRVKLEEKMKKVIKRIMILLIISIIVILLLNIRKEKIEGISVLAEGSSSTTSDIQLMARAINGEARGEPYEGQVAVGAVILNRVSHASFPNTIAGVIYQKGAFNVVDDGQINLSPNSTAVKAAQDALNGWDPTSGCIYYFNPNTATNSWIWSRQVKLTIGKHKFAI